MDFWDAVVSFFTGFEPRDFVTVGLSVAAVVISVVAIRQKSTYLPKPLMVGALTEQISPATQWTGESREVMFQLENKGNGPAHHVTISQLHKGKSYPISTDTLMNPGSQESNNWTVHTPLGGDPPFNPRDMWIEVRWTQPPYMEKTLRKVFKLPKS